MDFSKTYYFYRGNGDPICLENQYYNQSCFLIGGGPSLNRYDLSLLNSKGILTMGINNASHIIKTNLWVAVDIPSRTVSSILEDPTIQKFMPLSHRKRRYWYNGLNKFSNSDIRNLPNMFFIKNVKNGDPSEWFNKEKIQITTPEVLHPKTFLTGLRVLWILGVRKVFLIGCDFKCDKDYNYIYDNRSLSDKGVHIRNKFYNRVNDYCHKLFPHCIKNNFFVYNCQEDSNLTAFPHISYEEALNQSKIYIDCWDNIRVPVKEKNMRVDAKSILITNKGNLLSNLYTEPLIRSIKEKFNNANIFLKTSFPCLFKNHPLITNTYNIKDRTGWHDLMFVVSPPSGYESVYSIFECMKHELDLKIPNDIIPNIYVKSEEDLSDIKIDVPVKIIKYEKR